MKRKALWFAWALAPAPIVAFHFGPGQRLLGQDTAGLRIEQAGRLVEQGDWMGAAEAYGAARTALGEADAAEVRRLALSEAVARVRGGEVLEGAAQLEELLADVNSQDEPDEEFADAVREELGTAQYFTAWLMRLEGATADEWKPEAEKARQHFRLLAEESEAAPHHVAPDTEAHKKNLEAVIRFEQMDLSELEGLPLPKDCPGNCEGLSQRKREQRMSKSKGKEPKDAREKVQNDGAGAARKNGKGS